MKPKKTWVIVTNGETARLFDLPGPRKPPVPLEDHVWQAPEVNDYADAQGVTHSSFGHSQHRMAPSKGVDPGQDAFAQEIAEKLASALQSGAFERLVIAAAPRMMGHLRDRLDAAVKATVWVEVDKDFTHMPLEDLEKALDRHLYP